MTHPDRCTSSNSITEELSNLCGLFPTHHQSSTNRLRAIVKSKCFEAGQLTRNFSNNLQHDAGEFIQSLLEHLWHENNKIPNLKEEVFGGLCQDVLVCVCRATVELPIHNFPEIIPLQMSGQCIQSSLN